MLAVTHGLQDPYEKIIHDKCKRSCKINPEIRKRFRQHFRRCSHQYQYLWSCYDPDDCQDNSADYAERDCCMDGLFQIFSVPCTEIFSCHYTGSDSNPVKKTYQQKNQVARRADGSQRIIAKKIADNHRVGSVVKLLK